MEKRWIIPSIETDPSEIAHLSKVLNIETPLVQLLWSRGIRNEKAAHSFSPTNYRPSRPISDERYG